MLAKPKLKFQDIFVILAQQHNLYAVTVVLFYCIAALVQHKLNFNLSMI